LHYVGFNFNHSLASLLYYVVYRVYSYFQIPSHERANLISEVLQLSVIEGKYWGEKKQFVKGDKGGHRGVAGGHSPPPDRFREGRSPPPEISRQKMFPI